MIRSGEPECRIALHPLKTDDGILHGLVHCMSHMKLSRHVRGRHHHRKRNFSFVNFGMKQSLLHPVRIDAFLELLGIVR